VRDMEVGGDPAGAGGIRSLAHCESLLRRLVWPGSNEESGLLERSHAEYGPDRPPVAVADSGRPDGRYRLRYWRHGIMRTAAEVYPARQAPEQRCGR
jgi:hypothetical protein